MRWLLVLSALVTSCVTLYLAYDYFSFPRNAERVTGTVVELRPDDGAYRPVVEFVTLSGERITLVSIWSTRPSPFSVGQIVTVMYPPGDPQAARVDSFWWNGIPLLIAGAISLVHGVFALFLFVRVQRAKPDRKPA